jgi:hypothetical protein
MASGGPLGWWQGRAGLQSSKVPRARRFGAGKSALGCGSFPLCIAIPLSRLTPLGLKCDFGCEDECKPGGPGGGGGPIFCDPNIDPACIPPTIAPPGGPGNDGGGGGSGSAGGAPSSNKGGNRGPWTDNETLGLPRGLNLRPATLADLLGLSPGTQCDFGVCSPIGNGFAPAGALAVPCIAQPEACAAILIGTYVIVVYGPQIIQAAKEIAKEVDCATEWAEARRYCAELYSQPPASRPPSIWGGSYDRCVHGQVSERCGGNPIDWGRK